MNGKGWTELNLKKGGGGAENRYLWNDVKEYRWGRIYG
jgi:hypothetical protein